jgi:ectoine hydroxylase-related dioxygenase (phytanoyl-CoA dioxygenase family)
MRHAPIRGTLRAAFATTAIFAARKGSDFSADERHKEKYRNMAPLLSNEQKRFLRENGYVVVKRGVDPASMKAAQQAAMRLTEKCANGTYPYCRADQRLSDTFIEKIEHIFHPDIFEPDVFKAVVDSRILEYAADALGTDDVFVSFFRMHPTVKYSAWSSWHRDDAADDLHDNTIKATLPLFPECGFHVVPGSQRKGNKLLDGGTESEFKDHLPGEVCVPVEAGDILLFHTAIAHRAACAGRTKYRRAQVHFRVTATQHAAEGPRVNEENWSTRPEVLAVADAAWRAALTKEVKQDHFYPITTRGAPTRGIRGYGKQMLARAFYYASAFLPDDHRWLSDPPKGYVPYVRVAPEHRSIFVD